MPIEKNTLYLGFVLKLLALNHIFENLQSRFLYQAVRERRFSLKSMNKTKKVLEAEHNMKIYFN